MLVALSFLQDRQNVASWILEPGYRLRTRWTSEHALFICLDARQVVVLHPNAALFKLSYCGIYVIDHEVEHRMFRRVVVVGFIDEYFAAAGEMKLKALRNFGNLKS